MSKISVILPMYNENYNIVNLLKELKINKLIDEIIVVDDCSTDNTIELINNLKLNHIRILSNYENKGQSLSIYKGVSEAKNDIVAIMDSDGQNDPKYLNQMVQLLKSSNNKMIMGRRINRKNTFLKKIQSKIGNTIRRIVLNDNCNDSGCGLKVIYKETFIKLHFINNMHRFMPYLLKLHNFKYDFLEIEDRKRNFGKSNYNLFVRFYSIFELFFLFFLWFLTTNLRK